MYATMSYSTEIMMRKTHHHDTLASNCYVRQVTRREFHDLDWSVQHAPDLCDLDINVVG